MQHVVAARIELCGLHHSRKATDGNRRPDKLDDVYGSRWITAGAGSVVHLYGEAGDRVVQLHHLKHPSGVVGPLRVFHDHRTGRSWIAGTVTVDDVLRDASSDGVTVKSVAARLFDRVDPDRAMVEKARRRLNVEVRAGRADKVPGLASKDEA